VCKGVMWFSIDCDNYDCLTCISVSISLHTPWNMNPRHQLLVVLMILSATCVYLTYSPADPTYFWMYWVRIFPTANCNITRLIADDRFRISIIRIFAGHYVFQRTGLLVWSQCWCKLECVLILFVLTICIYRTGEERRTQEAKLRRIVQNQSLQMVFAWILLADRFHLHKELLVVQC
jgi:hypothetical protein